MKEKITEFDIMEEQHDLDIRLRKHKQLLASIRKGRRMGEEEELTSYRFILEQFVSNLLYVELCYDTGIRRYVLEAYPQTLGMKHLDKEWKFRTKFFAMRAFSGLKDIVKNKGGKEE